MRILRVRLKNYRGIDEREVHLAPTGVTIVQGPNEIGKSCIAESLDILFDHLDSTTRKEVKAIKPVDRDAGAEIEIDIESPPYVFTYFKRFHRDRQTLLTITKPSPESLTGREAHERAAQILDETIDAHLWRALRIQQGGAISQADLSHQKRLSACLDRAAGTTRSGEKTESLYDVVRAEYLRYFTPQTGQELKELVEARKTLELTAAAVGDLEAQLARIEDDVAHAASLQREIKELSLREIELGLALQAHEQNLRKVDALQTEVRRLGSEHESARVHERETLRALKERRALVAELVDARLACAALRSNVDAGRPALEAATRELEQAEGALAEARAAREESERRLALRRGDHELRRQELELEQLSERKSRIEAALGEACDAQILLEGTRITAKLLDAIEKAHLDVERARARLQASAPEVHIEALSDIEPEIDGRVVALRRGKIDKRHVSESLQVTLAGLARIDIRAGTSMAAMQSELEQQRRRLAVLCDEAGVADRKSAAAAHEARREAERALERRDRVLKENLRDLDRDRLASKLSGLHMRVEAHRAQRTSAAALGTDLEHAKRDLVEAEAAESAARGAFMRAESRHTSAREQRAELYVRSREDEVRVEAAAQALANLAESLNTQRAKCGDEELEARALAAHRGVENARVALENATRSLDAADPERTQALTHNARAGLENASAERRKLELEQAAVRARLAARGEEGLGERRLEALTRRLRAESDLARLCARASAAKLLFETMSEERESARRAYVQPLADKIDKLGRYVFGPTFAITLGESLQVASRTLEGRTVPFEDLSGGAQEQISLIARLACALIVGEEGGVPLILDDALGYTDARRLEEMGALLSLAGKSCQLILLTCAPERYRHIGDARIVRLS